MTDKKVVLTCEGLKKVEDELDYLKGQKRREVAERIKQALSFGDLSENSEYDEAKNEQAQVETRIMQLEKLLKNAQVIDEDEVTTDVVSVGSKVKMLDMEFDEEVEYLIVGSTEANPDDSKISNESPVGAAVIGRKVGDIVEVEVPVGIVKYKILDIKK
ncbi:MAG: transcription elongation factor GreA [Clostridiales bacterium]|nr:transcription elongation factor GreA [Clostridiales bacterium]